LIISALSPLIILDSRSRFLLSFLILKEKTVSPACALADEDAYKSLLICQLY
jgi:hypothetical protein